MFRGFVRLYLEGGGLPSLLTGIVAAVIFGMAHAYQGSKGIFQTTALGGVLMALFAASGSLIPGMVVHALIGLRFPLVFRGGGPER